MSSRVLVSRSDKLGDLVLALPAVAHLKRHLRSLWEASSRGSSEDPQPPQVVLHVSAYAGDIGKWACFNGVCDHWVVGEEPLQQGLRADFGLSLFHGKVARKLFQNCVYGPSLGPRSKLSSLWTYTKSIAQNRSHVAKSEMEYNVDLADKFLSSLAAPHFQLSSPPSFDFQGLSPLQLPEDWKSPLKKNSDVLIVASNGNSAQNCKMERYIELAEMELSQGRRVDFLINGVDAAERIEVFKTHSLHKHQRVRMIEGFDSIAELIAHIAQVQKVYSSSTGPMHIAHALAKELHVFFPRTPKVQSFERWRPHGYWSSAPIHLEHIDSDQ